jgi:hypothetical protein
MDFNAISDALAARFSAANITPPTGEQNVQVSTALLPQNIALEPTVLVYPPSCEFGYMASTRTGLCTYPIRIYIENVRDNIRDTTLALKWLSVLYDQLDAQVHLGLENYVAKATLGNFTVGELNYGGVMHMGIEFSVEVVVYEPLNATA